MSPGEALPETGAAVRPPRPRTSSRPREAAPQPTWLTPYAEMWEVCGVGLAESFPFGQAAAALAPIVKRYRTDPDYPLRQFQKYLEKITAEGALHMASPTAFATRFLAWSEERKAARKQGRPMTDPTTGDSDARDDAFHAVLTASRAAVPGG